MKKSKKNKKRRKKQAVTSPSITTILSSWWKEKHPVLMFMLFFVSLLAVFYLIINLRVFEENIQPQIFKANAVVANVILNLLGQNTVTNDATITSSAFSIDIKLGCDALEPIALFVAAVLAYPSPIKKKLMGIAIATVLLLAMNIIRIVSLFFVGSYWESLFDIMHIDVWMVLFIFFAISLFFYWVEWTNKTLNSTAHA